ncbi:MAG: DUF1592 domain-containing protein [Verrucomicrobiae bacterium]|nr:DUF1592 domain-containing protein [Verrucomicrobiae bacterium]
MIHRFAITVVLSICALSTLRGENTDASPWRAGITDYCLDCHDDASAKGDLNLESFLDRKPGDASAIWENVVRRLRAGQMPPPGKRRPNDADLATLIHQLESTLDDHARKNPNPGRTDTFRRLTRIEYRNVIRDLLALDVPVDKWLPSDQESHGFDNVTVGDLSPTLLNRYISAAQKISRLAIGRMTEPGGETYRVKPDITQERHINGLPLGTRGGTLIHHIFPSDGEYEVTIRLMRDRNEHVEGLSQPHQLDVLYNGKKVERFTVKPARNGLRHEDVDLHLKARFKASAGEHEVGVTFLKQPFSLQTTKRQPYQAHYNFHRHPRLSPAIFQVSITGPFQIDAPGSSPSRQRVFIRMPDGKDDEDACAKEIFSSLARKAFRRPVTTEDLILPTRLYNEAKLKDGFEAGIEMGLSAILVSPNFLIRVEKDPSDAKSGQAYRVPDLELASRLSFFLWNSLPDEELLSLAERNELGRPKELEQQTRRLLADPRSTSLAVNFAGQWLHLRNLESITPNLRLFPDFDDNLRQAFRRETELLFESVLTENRPVTDLLSADHTFLNERLAKHYGIPHIYGSRFRKVALPADSVRGGLLRHGSILTVTSYATRTSPVLRGNWILENILGTPAPPPPPNVPGLDDNTVSASLPIRQRLAEHRANPACAACHDLMDPVGFSLERFDAVGRWRETEEGELIDAAGGLPDGSKFVGVQGLESALLKHPDLFAGVLTEKLLVYALGRGTGHHDAAAIRQIVRQAAASEYRLPAIVLGIVKSQPFRMRKAL